jgi:hypothetical protein
LLRAVDYGADKDGLKVFESGAILCYLAGAVQCTRSTCLVLALRTAAVPAMCAIWGLEPCILAA